MFFAAAGASLLNSGTIIGGNGGTTIFTFAGEKRGAGGAGVVGAALTIVNSGTIAGGISGDGVTRADAITFTGGANTLTLSGVGGLMGNIGITAGGSTVRFNQSADVTLANVITGAGGIVQDGTGALTLAGLNPYSGTTTDDAGTLNVNGTIAILPLTT